MSYAGTRLSLMPFSHEASAHDIAVFFEPLTEDNELNGELTWGAYIHYIYTLNVFAEGTYDHFIESASRIVAMFKDIEQYLLPFCMTISPHDNPNWLLHYAKRKGVLEAAACKMCELFLSPNDDNYDLLSADITQDANILACICGHDSKSVPA